MARRKAKARRSRALFTGISLSRSATRRAGAKPAADVFATFVGVLGRLDVGRAANQQGEGG